MTYDINQIHKTQVHDCSSFATGARYQVNAEVSNGEVIASEHIASCFDMNRAELVKDALDFYIHMTNTPALKRFKHARNSR